MISKLNHIRNSLNYFHKEIGMRWFYLISIVLVAFVLRIFNIEKLPLGVWQDEASFGYNAYCISETGRAANGDFLPFFFDAWGSTEYSNGAFYYLLVPLIKIFGSTIFTLRLATCVIGTLTVFFTYKLVALYFQRQIALLAAFLLAISPWHIQFSRIAMDEITLPLFFVLSFYLFSLGLKRANKYIVFSSVPIAVSFYCYAVVKLFVPLFYFFFLLLTFRKILEKKERIVTCIFIVLLLLIPMLTFPKDKLQMRFNLLSITNSYYSLEPKRKELEKTNLSFLTKNNFLLTSTIFVQNYFKHISADFLLKRGSSNMREHVGGRGQLLWFTFWMGLVGFFYLLFKRQKELYIFLIWFLLFSVPASLTWEGIPHAGRCICGLPVFEILASVGFFSLLRFTRKLFSTSYKLTAILTCLILLLIIFNGAKDFSNYLRDYFTNYQSRSAPWYNYDIYAISKATEHLKNYDLFIIPLGFDYNIFYTTLLFLQKVDPKKWLNKDFKFKYVKNIPIEYKDCNMKIAMIVYPGLYPHEETIKFVQHELTNKVMYEIKRVPCI